MHIVPRGSGAIDSKPVSRSFGVLLLRMTAGGDSGERLLFPQAYFKILRRAAPQDDKGGGERFARGAGVNCYCSGKILRQAQDDKGVFAAFKPIWYYSFE